MATLLPVALSAIQMGSAIGKESKLKSEADLAERTKPIKTTSQFIKDNNALAESELENGMSAESEKAYTDSVDRGLSTAISSLLKAGGSVNNIGTIYGNSEAGRQNLAVIQDQLRLKHIDNVMKTHDELAQEEEKNWLVNEYGQYKDKIKAIGQERAAAAQMKQNAFDSAGAALTGLVGDNAEMDKLNKFFSNGNNSTNTSGLTGRMASPEISPLTVPAIPQTSVDQINTNKPLDWMNPVSDNTNWNNLWENYNFLGKI